MLYHCTTGRLDHRVLASEKKKKTCLGPVEIHSPGRAIRTHHDHGTQSVGPHELLHVASRLKEGANCVLVLYQSRLFTLRASLCSTMSDLIYHTVQRQLGHSRYPRQGATPMSTTIVHVSRIPGLGNIWCAPIRRFC